MKATTEARAQRVVTHEQARISAMRFIDGWFSNPGKDYPRMTIPVELDDDDVTLLDYISQQEAKESR